MLRFANPQQYHVIRDSRQYQKEQQRIKTNQAIEEKIKPNRPFGK
jgi:hypothetical protein